LTSALVQAGAIAHLAGRSSMAWTLVLFGFSVLAWRLTVAGILNKRKAIGMAAAALLLTAAILFLRGRSSPAAPQVAAGKFRGVILLTEPRAKSIIAPPPPEKSYGLGKRKDPLSIPFDGVYWFFKFPDRQPPRGSYSDTGSPARKGFQSADRMPLEMEARQSFAQAFDLSCCSSIAVEILNADRSFDFTQLELILADERIAGPPVQSLGRLPIRSVPQPGEQVRETLTFTVPANPKIREFNSARVKYLRFGRQSTSSARIAVERFILTPR
jgi:hypothetical protein